MFGFDLLGKEVHLAVAQRDESSVEHAADVVLGIVDDPVRMLVPKDGHGDAPIKAGTGRRVGLTQISEAVDRVLRVTGAVAKGPAPVVANRVDDGHADGLLQPKQMTRDLVRLRPQ